MSMPTVALCRDGREKSARPLVNIAQACAIVGVCRRTITYWIRDNRVEYVRTPGGAPRIYLDSLFRKVS